MKQNSTPDATKKSGTEAVQRRAPGASSATQGRYAGVTPPARAGGSSAVQGRGATPGQSAADMQSAAAEGIQTPSAELPYLSQVQSSFGRHDVSNVKAHTGAGATQASQKMGATAYASGNHVAFAGTPDLFTTAHEAAHVVQQRSGVSLKGGVGQEGDEYEQHADAVAEQVVRGESAEKLLDQKAGSGGAAPALQRKALPKPPENVEWNSLVVVEITASALRVRSEPSTSSPDTILGRFTRGKVVRVLGKEGDWLRIDYDGQKGYMHGGYVKIVKGPDEAPGETPSATPTTPSATPTTPSATPTTPSAAPTTPTTGATAGSTESTPTAGAAAAGVAAGAHSLLAWLHSLAKPTGEGDATSPDNATPTTNPTTTPKAGPTTTGPGSTPSPTTTPGPTAGATPVTAADGQMTVSESMNRPMTVCDSNALVRNAAGKQSGAKIPIGTKVKVIAANATNVQVVTLEAGGYVATAGDDIWTSLGNLASGGADVGLGNERSNDEAKKAAAGITATLPTGRNIGGSPYTIQYKGHFSTSRDGYSLSGSLLEKVMRMLQWAIHNDMITGDVHISDGIRSPVAAHRISVAWHIQHDSAYNAMSRLKKLPGGKDADGTQWYQPGWSFEDVKKNAHGIRSSSAVAAEGYLYGDSKRAPNPINSKEGLPSMGRSRHCSGGAIDVTIPWRAKGKPATGKSTDVWAWDNVYAQFGLNRPLPKGSKYAECWHIEETGMELDPTAPPVSDPDEP